MFQNILFDLDGTLTDPKEGITKCVQYALASFGIYEGDLDRLICFIGPPLYKAFMEYYGFDEQKAALAVEKYRERFTKKGIYENKAYPGILEMLQTLKGRGRKIALATSKPEVFAKKVLDIFHFTPYFDVIVGSELSGERVEKADVIRTALEKLPASESCVMVGDRMHDIVGAKLAGIPSVGVRFGYASPGELEEAGADYIVSSVEELTHLLLE